LLQLKSQKGSNSLILPLKTIPILALSSKK